MGKKMGKKNRPKPAKRESRPLPRPVTVHYVPGEDAKTRHRRRRDAAAARLEEVRAWCEYRGLTMTVAGDGGNRWHFTTAAGFLRWHTTTGLAVYKPRYRDPAVRTAKCYEVDQLYLLLEEVIPGGVP